MGHALSFCVLLFYEECSSSWEVRIGSQAEVKVHVSGTRHHWGSEDYTRW